ncbi:MAG: hypothetical protein EBT47_06025, partial [Chloroflexi bacterium]|nr:hypothetical protein [Chloroflexota bacterium]
QMFALDYRFAAHPPLFYVMTGAALHLFGRDIAVIRTVAVICSSLTAGTITWALARSGQLRAGLLGGLALAVTPFAVAYGRLGYTYALTGLIAALCLHATLSWRRSGNPSRIRDAVILASLGWLSDQSGFALIVFVAYEVRLGTGSWGHAVRVVIAASLPTFIVVAGLFLAEPESYFRAALPLLGLGGWGLGIILDRSVAIAFDLCGATIGRGAWGPRLGASVLASVLLLPLGFEAIHTVGALTAPTGLVLPITPWLARDLPDARAAAAWVNARTRPRDVVITSPAITWLINDVDVADFLQSHTRRRYRCVDQGGSRRPASPRTDLDEADRLPAGSLSGLCPTRVAYLHFTQVTRERVLPRHDGVPTPGRRQPVARHNPMR